ncbi:hypothetical protein JHK82_024650 [Glycine max]|nr:hypothetical protein JHK82_024650 [Glycine max]
MIDLGFDEPLEKRDSPRADLGFDEPLEKRDSPRADLRFDQPLEMRDSPMIDLGFDEPLEKRDSPRADLGFDEPLEMRDSLRTDCRFDEPLAIEGYQFTSARSKGSLDAIEERFDRALANKDWINFFLLLSYLNMSGALATAASYPPMFNPLALIFVTFSEAIILGEPLTVGTVILVHGSFIFSLIAYCHIVAAICVAPFALYFERMTLTQGLFYYGMRDTSATYFVNFLNMKDSKEKMIGAIRKILGETREQQGLSENVKRKRKR